MDIKQIRLININRLKSDLDLTYAEIANRSGTSTSYLSQCISDSVPIEKRRKHVGDDLARRIEAAFNKPKGWLDQLHYNLVKEDNRVKKFPLLKFSEIKQWLEKPILTNSYMTIQIAITDEDPLAEGCFYAEVPGNALVDNSNYERSIGNGDIILVNPFAQPIPGDAVVVEISAGDIRLREYQEDGAARLLYAYDPALKTIELTPEMRIIGCVETTFRRNRRKRR